MLKYRCPNNNQEVTTSIETDVTTLLEMRNMKISVWCPYCVTAHAIRGSEAFIGDVAMAAE
jgi:hypothetical protein